MARVAVFISSARLGVSLSMTATPMLTVIFINPAVVILGISKDLPFASGRFCSTEGIDKVITLSAFRDKGFGAAYGVDIVDGPLAGLFARSVVVIDENGKVVYTELVPETVNEPNYEAALAAL